MTALLLLAALALSILSIKALEGNFAARLCLALLFAGGLIVAVAR